MKSLFTLFQKYSFLLLLCFLTLIIFRPLFLKGQIPFSSNLLVSFFNPWAQEKMIGWEQGIPNKPLGIDDLRIFYPQRHLTTEEYRQGILPLWNQKSFSGGYHAGLSETAVFYPLFLLFIFLPQLSWWIAMILLEPIAVSIGLYLYLRLLNLSKTSAIFGSLVLGFSGLVIVRMVEGLSVGHTLLWAPFVLYGIEGFFQKRKLRYLLITLGSLSVSLLAGWFQFAFYIIFLGGIYTLFCIFNEKKKKEYLFIFLPFILLPLITLFQIVPAFESFSISSRGATTTKELLDLHLMPWSHLLTYIFPDFFGNPGAYNFFGKSEYKESILYIGVIPFILSLFSISLWRNKYVIFFSVISFAGIILGIDNPVSRAILSQPIPIVSSFLPNRIFFFATIGLSILSSYGLETILAKKIQVLRLSFVAAVSLVIFLIANGFIFFSTVDRLSTLPVVSWFSSLKTLHIIGQAYQIEIAKHNLYVSDLLLVLFVVIFIGGRIFSKKLLLIGMFILTFVGQVYFAQKYIPFSQMQFVFPPHAVFTYLQQHSGTNRFIASGNGYITTNSALYFDLYSPDGVGSMYIERYGQLVTYMQTRSKDSVHIPRIEIRINPSADEILSGNNPYLLRFMQIDGVKYVVRLKSDPATVNTSVFTKVWSNNTWEIYSYKDVLPRIFWTNDIKRDSEKKKLLSDVFATTGKTVFVEKDPQIAPTKGEGEVKVLTYQPNKIVVLSKSASDGLVYISDNYVPQWKAYIDGKPTQLLRANYSFQAIPVGKGQHTVELLYKDTNEVYAFIIAGGSIIFCIIGSIFLVRKKKYIW